jgi:NTP pyrophosphatase (non-canonical NTP hydrolase)
MTFEQYQKQARTTALYPNVGSNFVYPTLGLVGEAGEVAEKVKKVLRDSGGIMDDERKSQIRKELGDVLWYIAQLCTELGFTMDDAAQENLDKLQSRLERGKLSGSGDDR